MDAYKVSIENKIKELMDIVKYIKIDKSNKFIVEYL